MSFMRSRAGRHWLSRALLLSTLAVLPLIAGLVPLAAHHWASAGDDALIERAARAVGTRAVSVGPFSRFGWHHPGPALFYVLAGPVRLAGGSGLGLPVSALLVNVACIIGIGLVLARRAGLVSMVLGLLVTAVYLSAQAPGFLVEAWNPYLPLLPFTLGVLLCWSLLEGDRWPLPLLVFISTFCVQSHVSYVLAVLSVGAATGGMALASWFRQGPARSGSIRGWVAPAVASLLVLVVLWLPVLVQQISGHPGNATLLARYFADSKPSWTYGQGLRELSTGLARLPGQLAGVPLSKGFVTPGELPVGLGVLSGCVVAAAGVRVVLRQRSALRLLVLVVALCLGVVVSVQRVVGPLFSYLVPFTWSAGLLAWVLVAVAVGSGIEPRLGHPHILRRPPALLAAGALLAVAFVPAGAKTQPPPRFSDEPDLLPVNADIIRWSKAHPDQPFLLDPAPTAGLVGATGPFYGLLNQADREDLPVEIKPLWAVTVYPAAPIAGSPGPKWQIDVALTDGTSDPPGAGQHILSRHGQLQLYLSGR